MLEINSPNDRRRGIGRARAALGRLVRITNSRTAKPDHVYNAHRRAHWRLREVERRGDWNELPG